jgi:hypothetical protein
MFNATNVVVKHNGTRKLMSKYFGPSPVVKRINAVAYELKLTSTWSRVHPVFHVSLLQKY